LYTAPVVKMNQPPKIKDPASYENGPIEITIGQIDWLVVRGEDPDSRQLTCFWVMPDGENRPADCRPHRTEFFTQFQVPDEPDFDDSIVEAHVTDDRSGTELVVQWHVTVPGGTL